ncbi:MAG: putative sulfate exporter family transporter [Pseudomonadota bacterium]
MLVAGLIAIAAQFIAEHYGAPAMLMALLFGIALHFLAEEGKAKAGIAFSSRTILRLGVALLGARISFEMAAALGWNSVLLVIAAVVLTIVLGTALGRLFGIGPKLGFLSAGSVAICGASAALAISAILPKDERSEERLIFTVVGVTVLSTVAMIVYPVLATSIGFDTSQAGLFLGATIHDVAQVVGAGFSISEEVGDISTLVKLIRVALLAPVILVASLVIRTMVTESETGGKRPPILPGFVMSFIALVALNSFGLIPAPIVAVVTDLSRWALLTAIAAVGLKTSLKDVLDVGGPAIGLIVTQTLLIGGLVLMGLMVLGIGAG